MTNLVGLLVGLPGSGKSTWVNDGFGDKMKIASSDYFIEKWCAEKGITYAEGFSDMAKPANEMFMKQVDQYLKNGTSFYIDRTNLSVNSRARFIRKAQAYPDYWIVAHVFLCDDDTLTKRLKARSEEIGKHIPKHVIDHMKKSYESPTVEEGIDIIRLHKT